MTKLITISLTCQKFQYGGGMERYLLDIEWVI